ncbi:hypothetical protein GCM10025868_35790 [Angustibacter aerolatus]|uniref:Uncharacterized protein n=1 Tax=Angustibacter aerolatus TaxID=1162965 RepID=A0ABQ6JLW7_9ACTN|nr:hypothetical protein GCM10025868_35790 [Angustibacter aerolatus]
MAAHPEHHPGDHAERDDADDGLELLLLALRQALLEQREHDAEAQAEHDGRADADADLAQGVAAALRDEEGRDDPDDERGLEALAQADDEGGQHGRLQQTEW